MKITPILFASLMAISTPLLHSELSEIERYNMLRESTIAPSPYEQLRICLFQGDDYYEEGDYDRSIKCYNKICFDLVPHDKDIREEAKKMEQHILHLFCDALRGRINCAFQMGFVGDRRIRTELTILNEIDPRNPKFEKRSGHYIIKNVDLNEEEFKEYVDLMLDLDIIEKPEDTYVLESGDVYIKFKECENSDACDSCCDSCEAGEECEAEKKST